MSNQPYFDSVGLVPGIPGHFLSEDPEPQPDYYIDKGYVFALCDCGFKFHAPVMKNGRVGARGNRLWGNHLEGVSAPEEVIPIAVISKKRVTIEVLVMSSTYSGLDEWSPTTDSTAGSPPWREQWIARKQPAAIRQRGEWVLGHRKTTGELLIVSTHDTRQDAIEVAAKWCRKQEHERSVLNVSYFADGAPFETPSFSPQASIAVLLDQIDECMAGDELARYLEVATYIDDALRLMPLIEAKRAAFLKRRAELFGR